MNRDDNHNRSPLVWRLLRIVLWVFLTLASYAYHALSAFYASIYLRCGGISTAASLYNWTQSFLLLVFAVQHTKYVLQAGGNRDFYPDPSRGAKCFRRLTMFGLLLNQAASGFITFSAQFCSKLDSFGLTSLVAFFIVYCSVMALVGLYLFCKVYIKLLQKMPASDEESEKRRVAQRVALRRLVRGRCESAVSLLVESEKLTQQRSASCVSAVEAFFAFVACSQRRATGVDGLDCCGVCEQPVQQGELFFELRCCGELLHACCASRRLAAETRDFEKRRLLETVDC